MRRLAAGSAALLLGLGAADCGGSGRATSTRSTMTSVTRTATHPAPRRRVRRLSAPALGARQPVRTHGAELTVTVTRVRSLTATRTPALPGTRQVGVLLRIANQSGQTYDSTSSGDVSLVLSSGAAAPLDVRSGLCTTPLVDFESMIGSGDVRRGCAAFSIPRGVRVLGVRFSPHAQAAQTLTWRVG